LYKTEKIKEFGKLKENIKLTFGYEFLLRLTHNSVKIMTTPRIGYRHVNFRENSLFWSYKNTDSQKLSENEVRFWLDTAKKEFFFKNKRDVKYVES
jgi:thymidylate synthase